MKQTPRFGVQLALRCSRPTECQRNLICINIDDQNVLLESFLGESATLVKDS